MNKTGKVVIEVVTVPNTSRDIKNKTGKARKILPGVTQTFAPVLGKDGRVKTGTTLEEYKDLMEKDPLAESKTYKDYFTSAYVKIGIGGKELDLSVPKDLLTFNWLKHHPEVCTDKRTLNPAHHTLIMIDKETEAEDKLSVTEFKMKAYTYLNEMDEEAIKEFLYLYGRNNSDTSYKVAKSLLADHIESNPSKFTKLYEDVAREYKINFRRFLISNIIEKRGGVYYYGEDVSLGSTPEQVVEYFKSPQNQDLYINLLQLLESK